MGMTTLLDIFRREYYEDRTIGHFFFAGEKFCFTLEPRVRGLMEPKVPGLTAIPAGEYEVKLTYSPAFKRVTPEIMNVPGFTGVRLHGGNRPEDTEGCPLVAYNRLVENGLPIIQGSAEADLVKCLTGLDRVWLTVHNAGRKI